LWRGCAGFDLHQGAGLAGQGTLIDMGRCKEVAMMMGYVEAPRAWAYTRGMARVLGLNLTAAVVEGWLSREELASLVHRCEICPCSAKCTAWLACTVTASAAPEFCPNKQAIEALAPGH
jgi:hypothetical protein